MKRTPSAEFVRHFSEFADTALAEPVIITRNGRDRLAVLSVSLLKKLVATAAIPNTDSSEDDEELAHIRKALG